MLGESACLSLGGTKEMATVTERMPEDLVIAVLHRVGRDARIVDDFQLASVFDEAARSRVSSFARFRCHPQYGFSKLLSETLQILDHAGSITRENAAQRYFRVSPHTAGPFGRGKYDELSEPERQLVDDVASQIRERFGPPNADQRQD